MNENDVRKTQIDISDEKRKEMTLSRWRQLTKESQEL